MIGTKIQECTELTNPTGEEKIPVSDGTGKAKVVKFKNISTTTQAIANANAAASAASSATSDVNTKIAQLNAALSSAQTQLQAMRAATEDTQDAIESAETATTGANTAKTNANNAASNANQAATNANNAYNRLSGLITQINTMQTTITGLSASITELQTQTSKISGMQTTITGLSASIADLQTQIDELDGLITETAQELSANMVTFNSGNTLPTAVTKKQIFQNTQTQKTYIGVPGGQTTYDFFYNAYLGHVEITLNQQFTVRDKSGNQGVFICKTRGGVLNLVEDGEIQENLCMAESLEYGWTVRGTSDPDAIKAEYETVNNPDYWKEI